MNATTTLKDVLEPPFEYFLGGFIGDKTHQHLMQFAHHNYVLKEAFPMWKDFVLAALNEKWERDFGEPLRWLKGADGDPNWHKCPVCKNARKGSPFEFCPSCGTRLLKPEGEEK